MKNLKEYNYKLTIADGVEFGKVNAKGKLRAKFKVMKMAKERGYDDMKINVV